MATAERERTIFPDSLPVLTLIPGGCAERPASAIITFEQEALSNARIDSLQEIPREDFAVVGAVLAIDVLDFTKELEMTNEKKRSILAYSLYAAGDATYKYIHLYMGLRNRNKIEDKLSAVWDSENLVKAYDEFEKFTELAEAVMPSFRYHADKRRIVSRDVAMLQREGLIDEEILGFFEVLNKILPRDAWNGRRERIVGEVLQLKREGLSEEEITERRGIILTKIKPQLNLKEKFFLVHPEISEVLKFKKTKLSNEEISEKLGIKGQNVEKLARALLYLGKIESRPSNAKKTEARRKFLDQIIEFRTKNKLGNKEIAQKLGFSVRRVNEGATFLIWMGLLEPLDMSEVLIKRSGRRLREQQLIGFLDSFPADNRVNLTMLHKQFCRQQSLDIGYDTFLSMYREIRKRHIVPPSKATYGENIKKRMIEEIQRIRATEGNVRINVTKLCNNLTIDIDAGETIFSTIKDVGPSNTRKWREEGSLHLLEILKEMAPTGEIVNILQLCRRIGISHRFGLQVYHEAEGKMELPLLKAHKQSTIQRVIFEANPM